MPKLFILVGIPGCGKTAFAHLLSHVNLRTVSSDEIREAIANDVNDQSHNKDVFAEFYARVEDHLLDGLDVTADATNLKDFARERLHAIAERVGVETHAIVFTNVKEAVLRNSRRQRIVPADVMVAMLEQYERALVDIPQESYASVTYIEAVH